jgi:hypothetical protein
MLVRQQTVAALHWIPDPKDCSAMKDNTVSELLLPVTYCELYVCNDNLYSIIF